MKPKSEVTNCSNVTRPSRRARSAVNKPMGEPYVLSSVDRRANVQETLPVPGGYSRAMTKWEYATVPLIDHATKQILDQWGSDGWELVTVITGPTGGLVAYLKRELA